MQASGEQGLAIKENTWQSSCILKAGRKERINVPVHGNKDLKIGMAKAIMKIAEIDESEL